ncbi:MAG: CoA pyrophosphatase [Saprospiraceae bacterium]
MLNLHPIKQKLIKGLNNPLPGVEAHQKMTVPGRIMPPVIPTHAKKAAVLVLFYHRIDRIFIAFIKRKKHEADLHSGQISFPGGKWEVTDDYPVQTALRESMEEIGITDEIEILGNLSPLYIPVSNFYVSPVIGWHQQLNPSFKIHEAEVDELIEMDLGLILDDTLKKQVHIQVLPSMTMKDIPAYDIHGHIIWGATAMILSELEYLLKGE